MDVICNGSAHVVFAYYSDLNLRKPRMLSLVSQETCLFLTSSMFCDNFFQLLQPLLDHLLLLRRQGMVFICDCFLAGLNFHLSHHLV